MAYRLPTFKLVCNIWRFGNDVQAFAADVVSNCSLVGGHHGLQFFQMPYQATVAALRVQIKLACQLMTLLLPKGTDIQPPMDSITNNFGDCVEVPASSGRYYAVIQVDDIGRGFGNEHRFALLIPLIGYWPVILDGWNAPTWPTPIP